jgi:16S rRNA (cytidine1402-2'-O)-methyltransferase
VNPAMGTTLFVVGTPIGNLGDMTPRALDTLRRVDFIAAEDTRRTRALLSHFEIRKKPLVSLEAHATPRGIATIVDRLMRSESAAYVTDAGMPAVSDPGAALVREAAARGATITAVPGPSALTAAIAVSGLVDGPFVFSGFLPRRGKKRREAISALGQSPLPAVVFEAPRRAGATLIDLAREMPERPASISRELTKLHEETVRGSLKELATRQEWRGEVVIVIGPGAGVPARRPDEAGGLEVRIEAGLRSGASTRDLAAELRDTGLPRRELYSRVEAARRRLGEP